MLEALNIADPPSFCGSDIAEIWFCNVWAPQLVLSRRGGEGNVICFVFIYLFSIFFFIFLVLEKKLVEKIYKKKSRKRNYEK